ncbi:hypothetical protein J8791_23405, partial [Klebsiella pneumoniae]
VEKNSLNRLIRCVCGKKIGPDPRNFNQRVSLGRNDLLIRTFPRKGGKRRSISIALNELVKFRRIDSRLNNDLREIIKYRNALVHGQDLIPSKIMLQKIDRISKEVESLLGSKD